MRNTLRHWLDNLYRDMVRTEGCTARWPPWRRPSPTRENKQQPRPYGLPAAAIKLERSRIAPQIAALTDRYTDYLVSLRRKTVNALVILFYKSMAAPILRMPPMPRQRRGGPCRLCDAEAIARRAVQLRERDRAKGGAEGRSPYARREVLRGGLTHRSQNE